jgi:hypothetical protein
VVHQELPEPQVLLDHRELRDQVGHRGHLELQDRVGQLFKMDGFGELL